MDTIERVTHELDGSEQKTKRCSSCGKVKPVGEFRVMNLPGSDPEARLKTCNGCMGRKGVAGRKAKDKAKVRQSDAELQIEAQKAVLARHADELAAEVSQIRESRRRVAYEADLAKLLTRQAKERVALARKHHVEAS